MEFCSAELIKLSAGAKTLNGVVCAEGGASLDKMPGGAAFKKKFTDRFKTEIQLYSPATYDATYLLVDAMKRANSIDPKVYVPALLASNFKGVTGTIAFESNGELKNPAMTLYSFADGTKKPLN